MDVCKYSKGRIECPGDKIPPIPKFALRDSGNMIIVEKHEDNLFEDDWFFIRYKNIPKKTFILKTIDLEKDICNQHICSLYNLSPRIVDYWKCQSKENYAVISEYDFRNYSTFDKILRLYANNKEIITQYLLKLYYNVLYMNCILGIYHKDLYPENIIVNSKTLELKIINFNASENSTHKSRKDLELIESWMRKEYLGFKDVGTKSVYPGLYHTLVKHITFSLDLDKIKTKEDIVKTLENYKKCL